MVNMHEIIHLDLTGFKEAATWAYERKKNCASLETDREAQGVLYSWGCGNPNNHCNHETILLLNKPYLCNCLLLQTSRAHSLIYVCIHDAPTVYTKPVGLYLPTLTWCVDFNEIRSFFSKSTWRIQKMDTRRSRFCFRVLNILSATRPGALSRGGPTTLTYHRPVPINRMAMCALCFLWMDVDMCDKGRVSKKWSCLEKRT